MMMGMDLPSPLDATRHQLLLGDDEFVEQFRQNRSTDQIREFSKVQRRILTMTLPEYEKKHRIKNEAMANAYYSGAYTMREIAGYFGVHYMTVSRAVKQYENSDKT